MYAAPKRSKEAEPEIDPIEEAVIEEPVKEVQAPKPIIIGIDITEKSIHNYIIAAVPEGKYISLNVEIANAGAEAFTVNTTDIKLTDGINEYSIDEKASYYKNDRFSEVIIDPKNEIELKIAFDIPDPNKKFRLIVKGRSIDVN